MACGLSALDELYGDETMLEDAMKTILRLSNNNSTITTNYNERRRRPNHPDRLPVFSRRGDFKRGGSKPGAAAWMAS